MKLSHTTWLSLLIGSALGAPEAYSLTTEAGSCIPDDSDPFPGAELIGNPETGDSGNQNGIRSWWSEDRVSNTGDQVVLNAPPSDDDSSGTTSNTKTTLQLVRYDDSSWYPGQWKQASVRVRHNGPGKLDKIVLESDISAVNVSIFTLWPGGSCPGTSPSSSKIRCEWNNVNVGFSRFSDYKLILDDYDPKTPPALEIPFTLTTYNKGAVVESTHEVLRWNNRRAALRFTQEELSHFTQPRAITVPALLDAETERQRLKQFFKFVDFHSTGFYLNPRMPLTVTVAGVKSNGPAPRLLVGTPALVNPTVDSEMMPNELEQLPPMKNGKHTVSSTLGGILYIHYTGANPNSLPEVTVTLGEGEAAVPFPLFREGVTSEDSWKDMLKRTKVPFAEHSGRRIIITGLAEDAKVWADRGQRQSRLFDLYRQIVETQDRFSGLDASSPDARDRPSQLGPIVVQTKKRTNPNAFHYRLAIPRELQDSIWGEYQLRRSWMLWHEFGHQRQQTLAWSWSGLQETTVNIYSLAVLRLNNPAAGRPVAEWEKAKNYLAKAASDKDFDQFRGDGFFVGLVMFEQLRLAFGGDSFYHQLHFDARRAPAQATDADKKHYFMAHVAEMTRTDLTDYFTKWGLKPEQRTVKEMQKQPRPREDYTKRPVYGGK